MKAGTGRGVVAVTVALVIGVFREVEGTIHMLGANMHFLLR